MEFDIDEYKSSNGRYYIREFLKELETSNKVLWATTVGLIKKLRYRQYHFKYSKPLKKGLFELRVKSGSDIARVIYCFDKGRKIWVLSGFVKKNKSQQSREIEKARIYMEDCLRKEEKEYGKK